MNPRIKAAVAAALLVGAVAAGYGVGYAQMHQPHMENALRELQAAKGELEVAMHNKGGHRERALDLTRQAIEEVKAGIADSM